MQGDEDELQKFREEWKNEVLNKQFNELYLEEHEKSRASSNARETSPSNKKKTLINPQHSNDNDYEKHDAKEVKPVSRTSSEKPKNPNALEIYIKATQYERMGNLSEALLHYRKATRLDPNIEHTYRQSLSCSNHKEEKDANEMYYTYYNFASTRETASELLVDGNPDYVPRKNSSVLLSILPQEVILKIFAFTCMLDMQNYISISLACKKTYQISHSSLFWHILHTLTFMDNRKFDVSSGLSWKDIYFSTPRVKTNGMYISRVNYIRQGYGEVFNQPVHLVTYYRYMRFYTNGNVKSITSTLEPQEIIRKFDQLMFMNGIYTCHNDILNWSLKDPERPKLSFHATMKVGITRKGRGSKLTWTEYLVHDLKGNESDIPLNTLEPFHFSKVKSWGIQDAYLI